MLSTSDRPFFEQVNVHEIKISGDEAARLNRSHLYKSSLVIPGDDLCEPASYKFALDLALISSLDRRVIASSKKKGKRKERERETP